MFALRRDTFPYLVAHSHPWRTIADAAPRCGVFCRGEHLLVLEVFAHTDSSVWAKLIGQHCAGWIVLCPEDADPCP